MPANPVIVPPAPTVIQGHPIESADNSPGLEQVQGVFDKVYPTIKGTPTVSEPKKTEQTPAEPVKPPETPAQTTPEQKTQPAEKPPDASQKLPSFLEEALKTESPAAQPQPQEDEWPEELPAFKTDEERKGRYKKWRDAYKGVKDELATLKSKPIVDPAQAERLSFLENQNKEMGALLSRMGVEQHQDFQQNIIRPMAAAWNEAARIVKDAGGDPEDLAKAMSLSGKAHFEALDSIFEGMPESAKAEVHQAISTWRRFNDARNQALQNAPKTFEELHKKDLQRQYETLNKQRDEQKELFDAALRRLRDDAKVEILQTSKDADAKWWNEQGENVVNTARALYMENTDMGKMAVASLLAPMADVYRKMWLAERAAHQKTKSTMNEHFEAEPSLSTSGGGSGISAESQFKDDLSKPFEQVFLREFHKAQARNR